MNQAYDHRGGKRSGLLAAAAGLVGALSPIACVQAAAQTARPTAAAPASSSDAARIIELEQRLDQRDALIRDLQRRVDRLEHEEAARASGPPGAVGPAAPAQAQASPPQGAVSTQQAQAQAGRPGATGPAQPQVAQAKPAPTPGAPAAAGPGSFTVSEEDAQRALERALVQTGAALLPRGKFELVPSVFYQYQELSVPGQLAFTPSNEVLLTSNALRSSQVLGGLLLRAGLPWDMQLEVGGSYAYKNNSVVTRVSTQGLAETGPNVNGFADPTITLTKQVLVEGDVRPGVFLSVGWNPNLGQVKQNVPLGKGYNQYLAGFTAVKRQDPLVFTGGFSYVRSSTNNGFRQGDEYIGSAGLLFAVSPQTSLQFSQQLIFYGKDSFAGAAVPGSARTAALFNAGVVAVVGRNRVITFSVGIGETEAAPNFVVQMTMPIRLN